MAADLKIEKKGVESNGRWYSHFQLSVTTAAATTTGRAGHRLSGSAQLPQAQPGGAQLTKKRVQQARFFLSVSLPKFIRI